MQVVNNIKKILNNMKLTEFCRQNKMILPQFPLDCTSIYLFTSYLRACNKNRREKITHAQFSGRNETPYLTLKTTSLCLLRRTAIFKKKRKKIFIKVHMLFIASFYTKVINFWMRWSLSWPSFSLKQTVFYPFIKQYIFYCKGKGGK